MLHNFSSLHTLPASRSTMRVVDSDSRNMHVVSWLAAVAGLVIMTRNGAAKKLLFSAFCVGMKMAAKVDPTSSLIVWHLIVGCRYI